LKKYGFEYKVLYLETDYDTVWQRNLNRKRVVPVDEFMELYDYVGKEEADREIILDVSKDIPEEINEKLKMYMLLFFKLALE
jgi:hypothetical protein